MKKEKPIEKQFWSYVIPSMLTMLLSGFYAIVDGFFVGQSLGDIGLGAINLVWPVVSLIMAIGTGVGIGGSVIMSTYRGEKNQEGVLKSRGNTLTVLLVVSVVFMSMLYVNIPYLLQFLGASGQMYVAAQQYIQIIALGCGFQIFCMGITPLMRNDGRTILAMSVMVLGLVVNIILDGVLIMVLQLGMQGAALATILSQALVAIIALGYLFFDKRNSLSIRHFKVDRQFLAPMVTIGMSPFGLSFCPSIIIMFVNWQCIRYGGDTAVAAYSVVSYVVYSVQAILQGVGDGVQPMISYCQGAANHQGMHQIRAKATRFVIILSVILSWAIMNTGDMFAWVFGTSAQTAQLVEKALWISAWAYPFLGIWRLISAHFYATGQSKAATILVYCDPLILTPILLVVLPLFFQLDGVWWTYPAAQWVLWLVALLLIRRATKI